MIAADSTLSEVCFEVSTALENYGMPAVLTGGSAAAVYAPQACVSDDADFVLKRDESLDRIATALTPIGFQRYGKSRIFTHSTCQFTVDFPKGPLAVGGDYIHQTRLIEIGNLRLHILTRTDCVRDRLAQFYFWDDLTALNAAVGVAANNPEDVDIASLRDWTDREGTEFEPKFAEFERRLLSIALKHSDS